MQIDDSKRHFARLNQYSYVVQKAVATICMRIEKLKAILEIEESFVSVLCDRNHNGHFAMLYRKSNNLNDVLNGLVKDLARNVAAVRGKSKSKEGSKWKRLLGEANRILKLPK